MLKCDLAKKKCRYIIIQEKTNLDVLWPLETIVIDYCKGGKVMSRWNQEEIDTLKKYFPDEELWRML